MAICGRRSASQFDNARDPYTARNALGITGTGGGGGGAPPMRNTLWRSTIRR